MDHLGEAVVSIPVEVRREEPVKRFSFSFSVERAAIVAFARLSGDDSPIHFPDCALGAPCGKLKGHPIQQALLQGMIAGRLRRALQKIFEDLLPLPTHVDLRFYGVTFADVPIEVEAEFSLPQQNGKVKELTLSLRGRQGDDRLCFDGTTVIRMAAPAVILYMLTH